MNKNFFSSSVFYESFITAFTKKNQLTGFAEDAAADAGLKFIEKLREGKQFENERKAYKYLWTTARRRIKVYTILSKRFYDLSYGKMESAPEDLTGEFNDFITEVIKHLTKKNAEVIELIHQGFDLNEIAEHLNEKPDTIKHRIARSVKNIKDKINF